MLDGMSAYARWVMTPGAERNPLTLLTPVEELPGVNAERAAGLRRLEIRCLGHLLAYLPSRHQFEEAESAIGEVVAGRVVSVRGEVTDTRVVTRGKPRFEAVLADHTGRLDLVWFNMEFLRNEIRPGDVLRVQGKAGRRLGSMQLINPRWEVIRPGSDGPPVRGARLRPIYPASESVKSWMIERLLGRVLDCALPLIEDHLSEEHRKARSLPSLAEAYRMMHRPASEEDASAGRRRLAYDELLLMQLGVHMKRAHIRSTLRAPALKWNEAIDAHIRARLPFSLTEGQEAVVKEIAADLQRPTPANRLIQGDVGSGKTVAALYAMLMAVASRHQAALMAPTELLAEQHEATIRAMLHGSRLRIGLLTGSLAGAERERLLAGIASGDVDLVIGTHALLTETVSFNSLAVAVIDEQHRFGVHQRARLREKAGDAASMPHVLVMTATPIPRTLALTVFGDLDISVLRGLPPGRSPIATRVVSPARAAEVYAYVRRRVEKGEQAYVVAPMIGSDWPTFGDQASPVEGTRDVHRLVDWLREGPMKGLTVEVLHGRMSREARERVMERFRGGKIGVLVSTTVIEVGVDVPNATMMVVEHADRFGLAQLHQLRGRVGRGSRKSLCVLIPSEEPTKEARARLEVLARTSDGFVLAEADLAQRGPGEFIGARQSGAAPFRVARFPEDMDLLLMARRDAAEWIGRSPHLAREEERLIRSRMLKAHGESLGLVDVG